MEPINGEGHPVEEENSLFEQVIEERNLELSGFDNMIIHNEDFNLAIVTMPDDYILRLYDYLVKVEQKRGFSADPSTPDATLERVRSMLLRLEDLEVVQEHMTKKTLSPEDEAQIEEIVAKIAERQRVRKMGPVQKLVYNYKKKRSNKK